MNGSNYYTINTRERNEWLGIIQCAEHLDIAFHPDYIKALESLDHDRSTFGGQGQLFVYENHGGRAIYPFMLKPISDLYPAWKKNDLSSPYGYSGPVWISKGGLCSSICDGFRDAFNDYCINNDIITEFYRINPFLQRCDSSNDGILINHGPLVYIDLLHDIEQINMSYNKSCRYSIRKAMRSGITIRASPKNVLDIKVFKELYDETMERNRAKSDYFFPERFYHSLASMDEATLLIAEYGGQALSAAWFLSYGNCVQYFLSGSNNEGRKMCASNLLLAEAIKRFKTLGMRVLCLGGGYGDDKNLLNFKLSFSPTIATFTTFRKVHDYDTYKRACIETGVSDRADQYFPPYRGVH